MPTLQQAYGEHDLSMLRAVAEALAVELRGSTARQAANALASQMLAAGFALQVAAALTKEAQTALQSLLAGPALGLPAAAFSRRFGALRPLGAGARERERPHLVPANASEALWYGGLMGKMQQTHAGRLQDFFFVPEELRALLPASAAAKPEVLPTEPGVDVRTADSALVDDAVTVLAYARSFGASNLARGGLATADARRLRSFLRKPQALPLVLELLRSLHLPGDDPAHCQALRSFLLASRAAQLCQLAQAWLSCQEWNDLLQVPSLHFDSAAPPQTAAVQTRQLLLALLPAATHTWHSLNDFVTLVRSTAPDFQRAPGDYDAWYVRDAQTGAALRGAAHWEQIDGALVRFLVCGPLHWLGLADLASAEANAPASEFRLTPHFFSLLSNAEFLVPENSQRLALHAAGSITVPVNAPQADRYQAARLADWHLPLQPESYSYQITTASLRRAQLQGIDVRQALAFLQRASGAQLPPAVQRALQRFAQHSSEARLQPTVVLRVSSEALLQQLQQHPHVGSFLGERLGPLTVMVPERSWEKLRAALLEYGLLLDCELVETDAAPDD